MLTCQFIAAVLHLGKLKFTADRHHNEDVAAVRNTNALEIVADFLGTQPADLEAACARPSLSRGSFARCSSIQMMHLITETTLPKRSTRSSVIVKRAHQSTSVQLEG